MTARKIRSSWWVDFRHDRVRIRKRSPDNSRAGAAAYEALLRRRLALGESLTLPRAERPTVFREFAWEWFETWVKTNNKYSEVVRKRNVLRARLIPFFGNIAVDQIGTHHVEVYKAKAKTEGLQHVTINNHLTVLSGCLRHAQECYDLTRMPKIKWLKMPPPRNEFLSPEEASLLLANASGVWRDVFLMALKTGLRFGELKALRWTDINWATCSLTVRQSWSMAKKGPDTPKSNRERTVPLVADVIEMLASRERQSDFVFVDERGKGFSPARLNRELGRTCDRAGIRRITSHKLRHTFASHLAAAGASMKAIQELLGHSDLRLTMRYAHLAYSSLKTTIGLLEARFPSTFGQPVGNGHHAVTRDTDPHLGADSEKGP
jgi:integrase